MILKKKSWIPYLFILVGIVLIAVGFGQMANSKIQIVKTLEKAKHMVGNFKVSPQITKRTPKKTIIGDTIGLLIIPKIKAELAIVEGTDPDDLAKGVGHYKGSCLPGGHGQIVLSGHRDTVFRHLGEVSIGDTLEVRMPNGTFSYKITRTKIVKSDDTSIITLQNKQEELILTTCYPFRYIGNAPKRYIIYAYPEKKSIS